MKPNNPLIDQWSNPFSSPPFDKITPSHFMPAIMKALDEAREEIRLITDSSQTPTFSNTIEALENSGKRLGEIASVLFNLNMAETSNELQKVAQEISPELTRFSNDITLNTKLFDRIKQVTEAAGSDSVGREQQLLLEKKMRSFILGGAGLSEEKKARYREVTEELSALSLIFEEHLLAETNAFELHLTSADDLAGLPDGLKDAAAAGARERGMDGWIITLQYPSYIPFMQYSDHRHLRQKLYMAFASRCFTGNENDNREIVKKMVNLRLELANLLGHKRYSDLVLEERMAGSTDKVTAFLDELNAESHKAAESDYKEVERYAADNGHEGDLERWDWSYWSEKLKMEKFDLDDEILRPFFRLEAVEKAVFGLATKLYGINFNRSYDVPLYHPEVRVFEVTDRDDSHLGILMTDYHPRSGKSNGAWMTSFREQYISGGKDYRPLVSIVTNFSRPSGDRPALLTHNELTTFLHEFGHAMHGILSKCSYESLSGTNVARDFVELPSQLMENWAYEKDWLDSWAVHYITGEKIPKAIIDRIRKLQTYNEGYACNRQMGFAILDMAWHTLEHRFTGDVAKFEKQAGSFTELFRYIEGTSMSCSFGHLFSGGYAAGYYGYKWAEALEADAFSLFIENGITDAETAGSFRRNILERGGSEDPALLYRNFRKKEPSIEALLIRSGFKKE